MFRYLKLGLLIVVMALLLSACNDESNNVDVGPSSGGNTAATTGDDSNGNTGGGSQGGSDGSGDTTAGGSSPDVDDSSVNNGEPEFADINGSGCQPLPVPGDIGSNIGDALGGGDSNSGQDLAKQVKHVFIIVFENKCFDKTFGSDSPAPYLAKTLTAKGQLLRRYYGIGHLSLTNYIAMISGQAPNLETQTDCKVYLDFLGGGDKLELNGQAVGEGCVYPESVTTVADQLEQNGFTWKAYMEDMGNATAAQSATCRHPRVNTYDDTQSARIDDQYTARHNPFVYFHSIIDDPARCSAHDVPLSHLTADLQSIDTTPNYVFVTPNLCNDAHDQPCVDGRTGGLKAANTFLEQWVPRILNSPAFKDSGLLVITFDEAESDQNGVDARACCNELPGPNSALPGVVGPGGGRTGTVLISPFITPGSSNDTPYNHYSLLRSIENIFGLDYLGYARQEGLNTFGADVFNGDSS